MAVSDSQKRATTKYNRSKYDQIKINVNKTERLPELLSIVCERSGKSQAAYVLDAIKTQLAADGVSIADLPPAETDNATKV